MVKEKVLKLNCDPLDSGGPVVSGERIVFNGNEFAEIRLSLGPG